jgi:hypothetical protein
LFLFGGSTRLHHAPQLLSFTPLHVPNAAHSFVAIILQNFGW